MRFDEADARIGGLHPIRSNATHSMHVYVYISYQCSRWLRRELGALSSASVLGRAVRTDSQI